MMRRNKTRPRHWKKCAAILKRKLGEKLFLNCDARDPRIGNFVLFARQIEGPGHPPAYIPKSQDMVNQFSFWPRYDQFVELKPGVEQLDGEVYTEENGINLFLGHDGSGWRKGTCTSQYPGGISVH